MNLVDESIYGASIKDGKLDLHSLFSRLRSAGYVQYHDPCFSDKSEGCCIMLNGCLCECFTNGEPVSYEDKLSIYEELTPLFKECKFGACDSPFECNPEYFEAVSSKLSSLGYNSPHFGNECE